jgi:hypothetical protein
MEFVVEINLNTVSDVYVAKSHVARCATLVPDRHATPVGQRRNGDLE